MNDRYFSKIIGVVEYDSGDILMIWGQYTDDSNLKNNV